MQDEPRFFQSLDLAEISDVVMDCDDTMYPANIKGYPRGTVLSLHQRIKRNIVEKVNTHPEMLHAIGREALDLSQLKEPNLPADIYIGLIRHYQAQGPEALDDLLHKFYDVTYDFTPDRKLGDTLAGLDAQGVRLGIDTNGVNFNVVRVLDRHGVDPDLFDGRMFDIVMAKHGKETPERVAEVIEFFGINDPERALYVDDSPKVLKSFKEGGFKTVWINDNDKKLSDEHRPFIDAVYPSLSRLTGDILSTRLAVRPDPRPTYRPEYRI